MDTDFAGEAAVASSLDDGSLPSPAHFDEWHDAHGVRAHWQQFFQLESPVELAGKQGDADRQIRDNGITYNVYADTQSGPARPWSLDILPFILDEADWQQIASGVSQRARLLNQMLADLYGAQTLLHRGLVPSELVLGHPGYLRALAGHQPAGGVFLHIVAFDLARHPNGRWSVMAQRTQAPSGLGYALENRLIVSRLFPEAFRQLRVQHLASSYQQLLATLTRLSPPAPRQTAPRMVLLTPGPYNETYFEHAYLARYLGIPLVEGSDLTVRGDELFLKTLTGLTPVQVVLRRLDDNFCDPLELRTDSTLGIPGLLQAVRAGKVLMANALGSSFLESPALLGFLPGVCDALLGERLQLPSLHSWWCGEDAACAEALSELDQRIIKPTYPPGPPYHGSEPILCSQLDPASLADWHARILQQPGAYTLQENIPLSQAPIWRHGHIAAHPAMLRVFAIADGEGGWQVLPGGLTRIADEPDQPVVSMQRGGSSLDTWVLTSGEVDTFSLLPGQLRPIDLRHKRRLVTSRAAENLFWMGRYAERAEQRVRLAHWALEWLGVNHAGSPGSAHLPLLARLCWHMSLLPGPAPTHTTPGALAHAIRVGLVDADAAWSVAHTLAALAAAASPVRDRLSPTYSRLVLATSRRFSGQQAQRAHQGDYSSAEALADLEQLAVELVAIAGEQADHMTRDDGWRFLAIGRHLERLNLLSMQLGQSFASTWPPQGAAFELLLALFDSTLTYRSYYQSRQEIPALLDLLVCDDGNPRALNAVLTSLRSELGALPSLPGTAELATLLPVQCPTLEALCQRTASGQLDTLRCFTQHLQHVSARLSDEIGLHYFNHNPAWQPDDLMPSNRC